MNEKKEENITKDMLISDIVERLGEEGATIMMEHGLHCVGCHISGFETLEQGTIGHGFTEEDLDLLLKDLNTIADKNQGMGDAFI